MHTQDEKLKAFARLLNVLDTLREQCPWDKKQTNESLRPNTIEETYELCDALTRNDTPNICKELGDVLLLRQDSARKAAVRHCRRVQPADRQAHLSPSTRLPPLTGGRPTATAVALWPRASIGSGRYPYHHGAAGY